MSRPRRPWSIIPSRLRAGLGLLLAVLAPAAWAQEDTGNLPPPVAPVQRKKKPPPVTVVVQVGQENYVRSDRPAPVQVTLINNEKSISGYLELRTARGRTTRMPIDLPRGAQKYYT